MSALNPASVRLSLREFARHGGATGPHADGWGIAYFEGRDIQLIRDLRPAAGSPWVGFLDAHPIRSGFVLSHLRYATRGAVRLANTQPFCRELGGTMHVFAHNGDLDGIERRWLPRRGGFRPLGDSDSEVAFCLLLERLAPIWLGAGAPPLDERTAIVEAFAADLRQFGPANFIYSDGTYLFAHGDRRIQEGGRIGAPGLHLLLRECPCEAGLFQTRGLHVGPFTQQVALIASVPLSPERWHPFGEGELAVLLRGQRIA